jgi:hypothetical protein
VSRSLARNGCCTRLASRTRARAEATDYDGAGAQAEGDAVAIGQVRRLRPAAAIDGLRATYSPPGVLVMQPSMTISSARHGPFPGRTRCGSGAHGSRPPGVPVSQSAADDLVLVGRAPALAQLPAGEDRPVAAAGAFNDVAGHGLNPSRACGEWWLIASGKPAKVTYSTAPRSPATRRSRQIMAVPGGVPRRMNGMPVMPVQPRSRP